MRLMLTITHAASLAMVSLAAAQVNSAQTASSNGTANSPGETEESSVLLADGQVFDFVGGGVADAKIELRLAGDDKTIATVTTNQYGDFRLKHDKPLTGSAIVTVTKKYFKSGEIKIELGEQPLPFIEHRMEGAIVLGGTVVDAKNQKPISGAEIVLKVAFNEWKATSGEDGGFTIKGLTPGSAKLTVKADTFADAQQRIDQLEEAVLHIVPLYPERIVRITVVDDADKPVARASVECVDADTGEYRQSLTDGEGRAVLRGLSHKTLGLRMRLSSFSHVSDLEFDRLLELPEDKTDSTHQLMMQRAAKLTGTVISGTDGEPLSGARVTVGEVASDIAPRAFTAFDGTFELDGVAPGSAVLTVHRSGNAPELVRVEATLGAPKDVEIKMSASRELVGQVTDTDGKPLNGVFVRATKWREYQTLGLQAVTDADGNFAFIDAPADPFEISLYLAGYKPLTDQTVTSGGEPKTFALAVDTRRTQQGGGPRVGADAPDIEVTTLDGETIQLSQLAGKMVVLDFWATWCGPCVAEIPRLVDLQKTFGHRNDFVLISISLDDDPAVVRKFTKARKMDWRHVCGNSNGAQNAADTYNVYGIPAIFLIGPDGRIMSANTGATQVKAMISQTIKNKDL